ncbi:hypothetical protein GCM10009530_64050 [Microbispora corallina]|uniref:Uncharacterized protein n=1 Tax=Microbispora corallina TaxID=83302 RepID=A0ABQ4GCC5_9ACTN|nr:hypothetical protein [Microbispora corallina]GIH44712.1 hypothetical protein Mco01_77120 [Microbispora corallina]
MGRSKTTPTRSPKNGKAKPAFPPSRIPESDKPAVPRRLQSVHTDGTNNDQRKPVWRLSLLDRDHDGSWSWAIDGATLLTIVDFLRDMEKLTWKEIKLQQAATSRKVRARHHGQAVETLCQEARDRLNELGLDDCDELFRFRVKDQKGRLWGILSNESPRVFYPIWWDAEHEVYPVDKN